MFRRPAAVPAVDPRYLNVQGTFDGQQVTLVSIRAYLLERYNAANRAGQASALSDRIEKALGNYQSSVHIAPQQWSENLLELLNELRNNLTNPTSSEEQLFLKELQNAAYSATIIKENNNVFTYPGTPFSLSPATRIAINSYITSLPLGAPVTSLAEINSTATLPSHVKNEIEGALLFKKMESAYNVAGPAAQAAIQLQFTNILSDAQRLNIRADFNVSPYEALRVLHDNPTTSAAAKPGLIKAAAAALIADPSPTRDLTFIEKQITSLKEQVEADQKVLTKAQDEFQRLSDLSALALKARTSAEAINNFDARFVTLPTPSEADRRTRLGLQQQASSDFANLNKALGTDAIPVQTPTPVHYYLADIEVAFISKIEPRANDLHDTEIPALKAKQQTNTEKLAQIEALLAILKDNPNYPAPKAQAGLDALLAKRLAIHAAIDATGATEADKLKVHADHLLLSTAGKTSVPTEAEIQALANFIHTVSGLIMPGTAVETKQKIILEAYKIIAANPQAQMNGALAVRDEANSRQQAQATKALPDEAVRQQVIAQQIEKLMKGYTFSSPDSEAFARKIANEMLQKEGVGTPYASLNATKKVLDERVKNARELRETLNARISPTEDDATRKKMSEAAKAAANEWFISSMPHDPDLANKQFIAIATDPTLAEDVRKQHLVNLNANKKSQDGLYKAAGGKDSYEVTSANGVISFRQMSGANISAAANTLHLAAQEDAVTAWRQTSSGLYSIDAELATGPMKAGCIAATMRLFDESCTSTFADPKDPAKRTDAVLHIRYVQEDLKLMMVESTISWLKANPEAKLAALPEGKMGKSFYDALEKANLSDRLLPDVAARVNPPADTSRAFEKVAMSGNPPAATGPAMVQTF